MKRQHVLGPFWSISLAGLLCVLGTNVLHAQFKQNKKDTIKIDSSTLPKDIQNGYRLYRGKCGECHGLDTGLKPSMSSTQWDSEVKRMQAMASSQFNDQQATAILKFINYDEEHRKSALKPAAAAASGSDTVAAGRQFYLTQGCDTCHSIAGNGGSLRTLDGVGTKLSREELIKTMQAPPAGSAMPPLPKETTQAQVNSLADYLLTLTGH